MGSKLERKIRLAFRFFDRDRDGLVSKKDMLKVADLICSLTKANHEETEITRAEWVKWCEVFPEGDLGANEEVWVMTVLKYRAEHVEEMKKGDVDTYGNLFDRVDLNKDGFIDRDELGLYYQAFGVTDKKIVEKVFRQLDLNEDGRISRYEFVTAGVEYWASDTAYEFLFDVPDN